MTFVAQYAQTAKLTIITNMDGVGDKGVEDEGIEVNAEGEAIGGSGMGCGILEACAEAAYALDDIVVITVSASLVNADAGACGEVHGRP